MIWSILTGILPWNKRKKEESNLEITAGYSNTNGSFYNKIGDYGIDISTLVLKPKKSKRKNLIDEVNLRFKGTKSNRDLEGAVYGFMKDFVFNDNNFDYEKIDKLDKISNYFDKLSGLTVNENTKQALETSRTVLSHLNDYLSGERKGSFRKYLFGEKGVLTQRRLEDMKGIVGAVNEPLKYDMDFEEGENYVFKKGKNDNGKFNRFNLSYENIENEQKLVSINDNESQGMYTDNGRLYWNSFDKMFDESLEGGKVSTRKAVKKNVKSYLRNNDYSRTRDNKRNYALAP